MRSGPATRAALGVVVSLVGAAVVGAALASAASALPPGASALDAARPPVHVQLTGRAVGAGSRLTYYASSASIRGVVNQAVWKANCNPAVEECWIDPNTGQKVGQEEVPTAAGAGYTQVDVLYFDDQVCVGRVTSHGVDVTSGQVFVFGGSGFVTVGGGCGDYWTPPEQLANLVGQSSQALRVLRGPYTAGSTTFEAISIGSSSQGASSHSAYEAATGLLVVASSRAMGGSVPTVGPGGVVGAGTGSTLLTYSHLLEVRTLASEPAPTPLPDHVARLNRMRYACSLTSALPGVSAIETPCQQDVHVVERAPGWLRLRVVRQMANRMTNLPDVSETEDVLTAGGVGGVYASIPWLRSLQAGVVLDEDPHTRARTTVSHVDGAVAVLVREGPVERSTYTYDLASGYLQRLVFEQQNGQATTTMRLELTAVE